MASKEEIEDVRILGDRIGYGNLMSIASELWKRDLTAKGFPTDGAFVPALEMFLTDEGKELQEKSALSCHAAVSEYFSGF